MLIVNVLALGATLAVAYLLSGQGLYRAALTLVACLVALAAAFGLAGPVSDMIGADRPDTSMGFSGDALALWALFAVVFLALRTLGDVFLPEEPAFPDSVKRIGGGVLGLPVGYLCTGLALVLIQMLPTPPRVLGGYAPFRLKSVMRADGSRVTEVLPDEPLWLQWDRGVLVLAQQMTAALGGDEGGWFGRYGDVYPPDEMRAAPPAAAEGEAGEEAAAAPRGRVRHRLGEGEVDVNDALYYHWYRRWDYIRWRVDQYDGPVLSEADREARLPGMGLARGRRGTLEGLDLRVDKAFTEPALALFDELRLDENQELMIVDLRFEPDEEVYTFPVKVESKHFLLTGLSGKPVYANPFIRQRAKQRRGEKELMRSRSDPDLAPVNLRYGFKEETSRYGEGLMDAATWTFTSGRQSETTDLIFVVPKGTDPDELRLDVEQAPAGAPGGV